MSEVDSLSIQLTADTSSAEESINKLIGRLALLKVAVQSASNFSKIAGGIERIADAARKIDADSGTKLSNLARGLMDLSKVGDLSNLSAAAKNLSSIIKATSGSGSGSSLGNLANDIRGVGDALGGIKQSDVDRLGAVSDALSGEMSGSLHSSNVADESPELGGRAESLGALTTVFHQIADAIRDATDAHHEFAAALGVGALPSGNGMNTDNSVRMLPPGVGSHEGPWVADEIRDAEGAFTGFGNAISGQVGTILTDFADIAEEAARPWMNFGDILKNIGSSAVSGIGRAIPLFLRLAGVSGLASDAVGFFGKKLSSIGREFSKYGFAAIPRFFGGQLVGSIQKAVGGFGKLFNSIKRIAMYRAIRSALRFITKGISDGIKHLYTWSATADGVFSASMDRLATSSQYVGNSIAAMASPLVNALAPAVDFIIDKFVEMFNTINQIIARLTGRTSYTAAKKVASQWSGAAKSASKSASNAAKEIRTILGFDEINKLNDPNSGGGGGGGGGGGAGSTMFEELPIESSISSFADQLKAAFEEGDWETLGKTLGNKVNEIVESIDWAGAGQKVGYYINGWFSTKYWTLDTINFTKIGSKIAEFLNSAVGEIDFGIIGRLLVQKMTIIGDLIIGFFTNFDWAQAGVKLSDFVKGLYDEITKWFSKYDDWSGLGSAIATGLIDFVASIDYAGIAESVYNALSAAFEAGLGVLTGFFDGLASKFKAAVNWDSLSEDVQHAIEGVMAVLGLATGVIGAILTFSGANVPVGIAMMIAGGLATGTSLSLMWDGLSETIKDKMELIKGIVSAGTLVVGAILTFSGANIPLGLGLMAAGAIGLGGTLKANWNIIKEKLEGPVGAVTALISGATLALGILALVGGMIPLGIGLILAGAAGLASTVSANWDNLKNIGKTAIEKVKEGWETIKSLAVTAAVSLVKKVGEWAEDVWEFLKTGAETIEKTVKAIGEGIATFATSVWLWIRGGAETIEKTVSAIGEGIATFATNAWLWIRDGAEEVEKTVTAIGEGIATFATSAWMWIRNGAESIDKTVQAIGEGIATFATNAWVWIRNGAESIDKTVNAVGQGIATFATSAWLWIRNGAETAVKTVSAIGSGIATFSASAWVWIRNGTDTVSKTVKAAGEGIATFAASAWMWIRNGTDTVSKTVKAAGEGIAQFAGSVWLWIRKGKENIDKNVLATLDKGKQWLDDVWSFIQGPVSIGKSILIDIGVKFSEAAKKVWKWLTGDGEEAKPQGRSWGEVDLEINPVAGQQLIPDGAGGYYWSAPLSSSATVDATGGNGFNKKLKNGALQPKKLGGTSTKVSMVKAWGTKDPIKVLGMDKLKAEILVGIKADPTKKKLTVVKDTAEVTLQDAKSNTKIAGEKALGGVFSNGIWSKIPQYASGTLNAGTIFAAGEAGPEVVGHVGGRTEVLNKSQLASAMYAAVSSAMAPAASNFAAAAQSMSVNRDGEFNGEMLAEMIRRGVEQAMDRQNELDRQRNDLLRQINQKDSTVEISTSSINKAQTRMNRRAGMTVVPVSST